MKTYGIYLAYPPGLDLRHEGLGRYLAAFVKGAEARSDVRFVLVCPSWSKESLVDLFSSEGVSETQLDIVSPEKQPMVLRAYEGYLRWKKSRNKTSLSWLKKCILNVKSTLINYVENRLVSTNSFFHLLILVPEIMIGLVVTLVLSPFILLYFAVKAFLIIKRVFNRLRSKIIIFKARIGGVIGTPKDDPFVLRLYKRMETVEADRMLKIIERMTTVQAWYSPTAFWPAFNKITKPRLMCVPDVVLSDFPVGFSDIGGDRTLKTFESVQSAIHTADYFVTYSDAVKWGTLVKQYAVSPENVSVIHHAPNTLNQWISIRDFNDNAFASRRYCVKLIQGAMGKSTNKIYMTGFLNFDFKFIFYASQFRPNKNLIMLLRAYEFLLRSRYITHKLVLTGHPDRYPELAKFILEHGLQNDVICLHGLDIQELAACYKLADLAVNPSLSEGGCPFTFTEALSVGTPVVMARIAVTEEVLVDESLQAVSFFDPYDWRDIAYRIEWALEHLDDMIELQTKTYNKLATRTWTDVVNEHIHVLEAISKPSEHLGAKVSM